MAELEELEQEELDKQLLEVGGTEELPSVPTAEPSEPRAAKGEYHVLYAFTQRLFYCYTCESCLSYPLFNQ